VQPDAERGPGRDADDDGEHVACGRAGRIHGPDRAVAFARRRVVGDRPREEGAEQHDVGERAVGDQVRERP